MSHKCLPEEICLKLGCDENAECVEIDSESDETQYGCNCKTGYSGDGTSICDDIQECEADINPCGDNSA